MSEPSLLNVIALAATAATLAQPQQAPRRTGALAPGGTGLIAGRVMDPVSTRVSLAQGETRNVDIRTVQIK